MIAPFLFVHRVASRLQSPSAVLSMAVPASFLLRKFPRFADSKGPALICQVVMQPRPCPSRLVDALYMALRKLENPVGVENPTVRGYIPLRGVRVYIEAEGDFFRLR